MLEKYTTGDSFFILCLESMTAYTSWLPHLKKLKVKSDGMVCIDYDNIEYSIPWFTDISGFYIRRDFKFSEQTNNILITEILDWKQRNLGTESNKLRLKIGSSCNNLTINQVLHFIYLTKSEQVDLILDGLDHKLLIQNVMNPDKFVMRDGTID